MGKDKENPIKVYARVRPLTRREIENDDDVVVQTYYDNVKQIKIGDPRHLYESTYIFDRVFSASDTNETVYTLTAKNYISKVLNGTNCSLIAFGQTGSGKTHTLMADGGVTDYTITELFQRIHADTFHRYRVTCTFVQIYLEKVFDILGGTMNSKIDLPVREHPYRGIHVQGLSEHVVSDAAGVYDLFNQGKEELYKAETEMGHLSSRSHSIFQLSIEKTNHPEFFNMLEINSRKRMRLEDENIVTEDDVTPKTSPDGEEEGEISAKTIFVEGKLAICDLAGSERFGSTLVEKTIQTEAKYINSSLLQLGNVIYALSDKKERKHIPFRNSTLTRLLQECLGAKCITSFIICVAPSFNDIHETVCSLNFGTRARAITNKVRIYNSRENQEFINKRLSSRIFHLENKLRRKRTPQRANQLVQTEKQSQDDSYSILDITKYSLELTELLNFILNDGDKADPEKINKFINNQQGDTSFDNRIVENDIVAPLNSTMNEAECATDQNLPPTQSASKKCHFQLEQSSGEEDVEQRNEGRGITPKKLSDISDHESDSGCIRQSLDDGSDASDITVDFNDDFDLNDNRIYGNNKKTINTVFDNRLYGDSNKPVNSSNDNNYADSKKTLDEANENGLFGNYNKMLNNFIPKSEFNSGNHGEKDNKYGDHANIEKDKTGKNILSTFIETTSNISRIILEIQIQIEKMDSRKSDTILETFNRCRYCLDNFQLNDLNQNNSAMEYQKFIESACASISELCADVQYDITCTVKQMDSTLPLDDTSNEHLWFSSLNNLLISIEESGFDGYDGVNKSLIYYLVFSLQLLQIARLILVNTLNSLETRSEEEVSYPSSKPLKCSTSLEDTTVSSTTSGERRVISRIPSIRPTRYRDHSDHNLRKKNYVCKLFRQPAIKIKSNYLNGPPRNNFNNSSRKQNDCSNSNHRRSFRYESIEKFYCEKKQKHSFEYYNNERDKVRRSRSFGEHFSHREVTMRSRVKRSKSFGEKREMSAHDRQLLNMYYEIQRKYEEALEENDILWANMNRLEEENSIEVERARFQEEIQSYYADFKKTEDKLIATKKECLRYEKILEHAEDVLKHSTDDINELERLLNEQDETMLGLEREKQQTIKQKEIHIEQHKKMEEIRQGIILFQEIFETCITLSEELLHLSSNIEKKIQYGTKNFESIKDLEKEVYKLIESNTRYECVLHEICNKVKDSLFTIDEMHKKTKHTISYGNKVVATKELEKSNRKIKNDVQTITTTASNKQDTSKLTEIILSCDEEIIQTILVDDLRSSTDKNYIMLKDIKTSAMIKQLIREKAKLEDTICDLKETLINQDEDLAQNKQKIDLFVNELGKLDQQLNGSENQPQYCYDFSLLKMGSRYTTFPRAHEEFEVIPVPEMCYEKFTLYLHYYTNGLPPPRPKPVKREPPDGSQIILVEELDELKSEIDFYKRKCKEIELQYSKLNTCLEQDLTTTNKSLLCKIDYMKHVNSIIEKENREIKGKNTDQKNQIKTLRDENIKIQEQVEACRHQSLQIQTKTDISRLQLEKKLSKYNDKLESLENYIEAIIDQKESLKEQFDDSGLPNEDSSDTCGGDSLEGSV